jgi:hypothetical protein
MTFARRSAQKERSMKRNLRCRCVFVATVLAGAAVAALPAADASARGDGWQRAPFPDYDASCGTTVVHVHAVKNEEFYRETPLPDGSIRLQVTGSLKLRYSTDAGKTAMVNASGPGHVLLSADGPVTYLAKGLNSFTFNPEQAKTLGVPQISVSAGPTNFTYNNDPDDTVSGHLANIIRDICAELT